MENTVEINGVTYRAEQANGNRAVVVVDRGWVFCGDVSERDGRIHLTRPVWIFKWREVGFDGVIEHPEDPRVTLRPLSTTVDLPADAEIFRIPVSDNWGLE